jgi:hypothetical protein
MPCSRLGARCDRYPVADGRMVTTPSGGGCYRAYEPYRPRRVTTIGRRASSSLIVDVSRSLPRPVWRPAHNALQNAQREFHKVDYAN